MLKMMSDYSHNLKVETIEELGLTEDTVYIVKFTFDWISRELKKQKKSSGDVDIVIIAHGCIKEELDSNILYWGVKDVVLYEPWNCLIYACVVFGIANGTISPEQRFFLGLRQIRHNASFSSNWNKLNFNNSGIPCVPRIEISSVDLHEAAWTKLNYYCQQFSPCTDRIVIPYVMPWLCKTHMPGIPFWLVVGAVNLVCRVLNLTPTVHLAACLASGKELSPEYQHLCVNQYAYTNNGAGMVCTLYQNDQTSEFKKFKKFIDPFL